MFERNRRYLACLAVLSLAACGGGGGGGDGGGTTTPPTTPTRPVLDPTYRASGRAAAGDTFVHLFEWKWTDIASECETQLGPKGYKAVQVSPPQEDIQGSQWWTRYQPVSYSIGLSRSGSSTEFVDMVNRCKAVGVGIYVDAVINHMSAGSGTGRIGTVYGKYSYPGLYTQADFHPACAINNYQSAANVQDCELVGLADLKTDSATVQQRIADYLLALSRLGVAGFRLDAAKHIQPVELNGVISKVNQALAAEGRALPYYFAEVIDYGGEGVTARDYFGLGYSTAGAMDITEFKFRGIGDKFLGTGGQKLAQLNPNGASGSQFSETAWGLMPADKAVVFVENHDSQREGGISYRDGAAYRLAHVWMLAQPYGYPSVMSSYGFDRNSQAGRDAGPPAPAACASALEAASVGSWVCEHRDPLIANMVAFRRAVAGAPVANWWDNGGNAIAFSRGDKGFVLINRETADLNRSFDTGLPAGSYCDVLAGGKQAGTCLGRVVVVGADGKASLNLGGNAAVVLQAGIRL
ncbi:alpha-amylase family protein [Chitinimonas viridis]|uniref:Alpha-amylase n=1 Tax=Chitinimonas viridis TaxID=664880 RepID=A0ABT8B5C0_9NEIS|nr:alpha-amylase family protein [Chitinimonas viridis]MDN3577002.1 alpha-amylase family protein [Chitinimonas viridis]